MKPFNNIADPLEILAAMRQGVDYSAVISLRGFELRVRPLSMTETLQVAAEVQRQMAEKDEYSRHRLSEHTILARETLKRASCSDVDKTDTILTDLVMGKMTPEEIQTLFKQYVAVIDRKNPSLELMKPEDVQAMVVALKKNSPEELVLALTELSFSELASLSLTLLLTA